MKELSPFFRLYLKLAPQLAGGMIISLIALLASVSLLALSGWFLSASFLAGLTLITAKTFNFFTPGTGVRGLSILRTASRYFERVVNHDITFRLLAKIRSDCFAKLSPLSPGALKTYRQGDLLNRLVKDIDTLDHLYLRLIVPFFCAAFGCLFIVGFSLIWTKAVALVLAVVFLVFLIIVPPLCYRLGYKPGIAITEEISCLRVSVLDYISGFTDLLLAGAASGFRQNIISRAEALYEKESVMAFLSGLSSAIVTFFHGCAIIATLAIVSSLVHWHELEGTVAAMLVIAVLGAFEGLVPLPMAMQMMGKVVSSARRVNDITSKKPDVVFPEENLNVSFAGNKSGFFQSASIDFVNVSYCYPDGSSPVFENLGLRINAGESVAITGHTGCGKSTLFSLLVRDDVPLKGDILINQQTIESLCETSLRQCMAVMPQSIHIFSATLRDNLLPASPEVDDSKLCEIIESLGLAKNRSEAIAFLDTWVGESGRILSGGEARRVGIARVLLQSAPVVLLDEPTEGLDAITESVVLDTLFEYSNKRTVLVATHKPAILNYVDRHIFWDSLIKK